MKNLLPLLGGLAGLAFAAPTDDTSAVCAYLADKYPEYLAYDPQSSKGKQMPANASVYHDINTVWWNAANSELRSSCAFFPGDADMVADAVKQLNKHKTAPFALKSGGHQPAPGFSSVDNGVMISFRPNMNKTVRTDDGKHFWVGPGARWGEAYEETGKTNQVVVGGRLGHIGVGGFVVGGGLSFYSAQYGLACDNADEFEAVLANGTVVTADKDTNPDLWWALRGGGNQFAVVTNIKLQAHPAGDNGKVWGGIRTYNPSKRKALFKAITNFVRDYPDEKAAIIPTFQFGAPLNLLNLVGGPLFFFFYDGANPPEGLFKEFDDIDSLTDDTKTKSYSELTNEAGGAAPIPGFGASFRENTYPNMEADKMADFYEDVWQEMSKQSFVDSLRPLDLQIMGFDPQPVSVRIAKASNKQGGNALGLKPEHGDRVWIENNLLWLNDNCNEQCPAFSKKVSQKIHDDHKKNYPNVEPTNYESGDLDYVNYNPQFLNDAAPDQDVYTSYGDENLQRLQKIKAAYDPSGFFTNRQGGFKLPPS